MSNLTDKIDEQGAELEKLVEILEEMEAKMEILTRMNKRYLAQQDGINDTEDLR